MTSAERAFILAVADEADRDQAITCQGAIDRALAKEIAGGLPQLTTAESVTLSQVVWPWHGERAQLGARIRALG